MIMESSGTYCRRADLPSVGATPVPRTTPFNSCLVDGVVFGGAVFAAAFFSGAFLAAEFCVVDFCCAVTGPANTPRSSARINRYDLTCLSIVSVLSLRNKMSNSDSKQGSLQYRPIPAHIEFSCEALSLSVCSGNATVRTHPPAGCGLGIAFSGQSQHRPRTIVKCVKYISTTG